jgi:hypothetical protein
MEYRITVNLNADEIDIAEHALSIVDTHGEIEAYFIAQALKQLFEKIETLTKDAVIEQTMEQGEMLYGQYKVAFVKGRSIWDFSDVPDWAAIEAQKKAAADEAKKLETRLKKEIPPVEFGDPTVRVTMVKAPRINPTQGFERPNLNEI